MTQLYSRFFELNALPSNVFTALILTSCLIWCLIAKMAGGLSHVCTDVVFPLVHNFFAREDAGDSFDSPCDSNFEAGPFSNTPQATLVRTIAAAPSEYGQPVRHTCTPTFCLAVAGRSHYGEACQSGSGRREFVPREPSMTKAAAIFGRDAVSDGVSVADDSHVVSDAPIVIATNVDEVSVSAEVNLQVETAPAVEACVPEVYTVTEMDWSYDQVGPSYVERMEVDSWWWQGVVPFEDTPEMMDIDVPVEGGLDGVDFGQPMQVMGAFPREEHSDLVACEDILMMDALHCEDVEMSVQDHMKFEAHSNSGVEPDVHLADVVTEEAPSFGGEHLVISNASPEVSSEGDVVLNRGSSVDLPTLPSTEVLEPNEAVLTPAPVQNQGTSEGSSGSAVAAPSVEQHPDGCQCASCATVARDVEEVRDVFARFEEEEEQEEAAVPVTRTSRRSRLLGRR